MASIAGIVAGAIEIASGAYALHKAGDRKADLVDARTKLMAALSKVALAKKDVLGDVEKLKDKLREANNGNY